MADSSINSSSMNELLSQLEETQEALQNLRFQKSMQQLEDLSQIRKTKKQIAKLKTLVFQHTKRDVCVIKSFPRFKMLFHQAYRQN